MAEINIEFANNRPFASGLPQESVREVNGTDGRRGGVRQTLDLTDHYSSFRRKCFPGGGKEEQIRAAFVTFMRTFLDPGRINSAQWARAEFNDYGGPDARRGSSPADLEKELGYNSENCPKIETPGGSGSGGGTPPAQAPKVEKPVPRKAPLAFSGPRLAGGRVGGVGGVDRVRLVPGCGYGDEYSDNESSYPGVQPVQPIKAPIPPGPVQPVDPIKPSDEVSRRKPAGYRSKDGPQLPIVIDRGGPTKPPPPARPGGQVVQAPPGRPQFTSLPQPGAKPAPVPVVVPPSGQPVAPRPQARTGFDTKAAATAVGVVAGAAVTLTLAEKAATALKIGLEVVKTGFAAALSVVLIMVTPAPEEA